MICCEKDLYDKDIWCSFAHLCRAASLPSGLLSKQNGVVERKEEIIGGNTAIVKSPSSLQLLVHLGCRKYQFHMKYHTEKQEILIKGNVVLYKSLRSSERATLFIHWGRMNPDCAPLLLFLYWLFVFCFVYQQITWWHRNKGRDVCKNTTIHLFIYLINLLNCLFMGGVNSSWLMLNTLILSS